MYNLYSIPREWMVQNWLLPRIPTPQLANVSQYIRENALCYITEIAF